ncbi:hypothetical protein [uncultured Reyranella sp.]|jgi:hypothetical protein|uniref:winged helix domain-containing protein n=1 Tax=uncultured Reyranella sp. TaxID=735512 RepID=UPI00259C71C1|nr:hypothetical protein [uncultured Reyranella sp.]
MRIRKTYSVREDDGGRTIRPVGRDAWMLDRLLAAGDAGTTSLETPAPRVSHYVWKLRETYGLDIETITEEHGGPFAGHHARYILRSTVVPIAERAARADRAPAAAPVGAP